jgi:thiol-disulfide isomerase/thioredoxin
MANNIELTLYHAHWCGACKNFLPEYEKMRNNKKATKLIKFIDYEEGTFAQIPEEKLKINGEEFSSYPTLKVKVFDDEHKYEGKRTEEEIYNFILDKLQEK